MATARTSQAHEKRVQKIAEEAASKIAADAPLEEEVVVVVEELPPGESSSSQRGPSLSAEQDAGAMMLQLMAQNQMVVADGISRWVAIATPFGTSAGSTETLGALFDVRRMTREGFRFAEELLESQKDFALRIVDATSQAKAA